MNTAPLACAAFALALSAPAHAQLIDAGNQAMLMHQGDLLEQQTAPNQDYQGDDRAPPPSARTGKMKCAPTSAEIAAMKAKLRPEYDRRVGAYGRDAATSWLKRKAAELGRQAAAKC